MPQPTEYQPETTFWSFEMSQSWFPGHQLDAEFANLDITLTEILANLALIQRDDGEVANETIGWDQLTQDVRDIINSLTATNVGDIITILSTKSPIDSPTFTGDPKAPTPATNDNDTSIATTAFVKSVVDPVPRATPAQGDVASEATRRRIGEQRARLEAAAARAIASQAARDAKRLNTSQIALLAQVFN